MPWLAQKYNCVQSAAGKGSICGAISGETLVLVSLPRLELRASAANGHEETFVQSRQV